MANIQDYKPLSARSPLEIWPWPWGQPRGEPESARCTERAESMERASRLLLALRPDSPTSPRKRPRDRSHASPIIAPCAILPPPSASADCDVARAIQARHTCTHEIATRRWTNINGRRHRGPRRPPRHDRIPTGQRDPSPLCGQSALATAAARLNGGHRSSRELASWRAAHV